MQRMLYVLGLAAIVAGAAIAANGSGFVGDSSLRAAPGWWMYGGLLISLAGAATIFAARGPK
jgi:hypothetical protein